MSYGIQSPAKKPSSLPRILTIICSVPAVIFLLVSTTTYVSARSKAQETGNMRAGIQSVDAKTVEIDSKVTSIQEQIATAKAKKDAEERCTDFSKDLMKVTDLDKMATTLKAMSEPQRNAVGEVCGGKKAFVEVFVKDPKRGMTNTSTPTYNGDGTTVTISGTVSLDTPTLAQIGSTGVVYEVFVANHKTSDSNSPLETTTAVVSPGGTGSFSTTAPFATTGDFYCAVCAKNIWPTSLWAPCSQLSSDAREGIMITEPVEDWYADPSSTDQLRWWDGRVWTDYAEPYEAPVPSPEDAEVVAPAVDEAFPVSSPEEWAVTSAGMPIPMPEASLPQEVTPASPIAEAPVAPIPIPGSPVNERDSNETDASEKSGMLKWILACAASWVLVAVFITVLVIVQSHLGANGRIRENTKSRAETAQSELDTARSTLKSINRQLQEAIK